MDPEVRNDRRQIGNEYRGLYRVAFTTILLTIALLPKDHITHTKAPIEMPNVKCQARMCWQKMRSRTTKCQIHKKTLPKTLKMNSGVCKNLQIVLLLNRIDCFTIFLWPVEKQSIVFYFILDCKQLKNFC